MWIFNKRKQVEELSRENSEQKAIIKYLKSQLIKKTCIIARMKKQYKELKQEFEAEEKTHQASLKSALKEIDHFRNELNSYINGWHRLAIRCDYPEVGKIVLLSRGRKEKSCVPGYYNGKCFCIWLESERGFVNTGDVYAWQYFPKPVEPEKMR